MCDVVPNTLVDLIAIATAAEVVLRSSGAVYSVHPNAMVHKDIRFT